MAKQISVYFDEDISNAIKKIAKENKRSFSSMLNILLKECLEKKK